MEHELGAREQRSPHKNAGLIYNIDEADPDFKSDNGQVGASFDLGIARQDFPWCL